MPLEITDFIEASFPAPLAYGAGGGPTYQTAITTRGDGSEDRNANWGPDGRAKYRVTVQPSDKDNFALALAFFRVVRGKWVGWRFRDPTDSHVVEAPIDTTSTRTVGPSDLVPTTAIYQFRKKYAITSGSDEYVSYRKIIKPIVGTITLLLKREGESVYSVVTLSGGATVGGGLYNEDLYNEAPTVTADVTIDYATGTITWNSEDPPGDTDSLIWTGDFEIPARFASDDWFSRRVGFEAYDIDIEIIELAEADAYV